MKYLQMKFLPHGKRCASVYSDHSVNGVWGIIALWFEKQTKRTNITCQQYTEILVVIYALENPR
jgi:hypothetical protein